MQVFGRGYPSLMPPCGELIERKRVKFKPVKTMFNADSFICRLLRSVFSDFSAIRS